MEEIVFYVRHTTGVYIGEITEFGDCAVYSTPLGAKPFKYMIDAMKFVKRLKEDTLYGGARHLSRDYKIVSLRVTFEEIQKNPGT